MLNSRDFAPRCMNYRFSYQYDYSKSVKSNQKGSCPYYLSPYFNYSNWWGYPNTDPTHDRFIYSNTDEVFAAYT
jgi:hypothetical protein